MKDKKLSPEKTNRRSVWEQDTYQTGSTCPPKSYGGVIAFLLVLVIFLCGISTALGLLNIRLFHQLNAAANPQESPLAFSQAFEESSSDLFTPLGLSGQDIPEIWSIYQDIPQGIYITEVEEDSDAFRKGIVPGDILLRVDGKAVTDTASLHQLLSTCEELSHVQILIYRTGKQHQMTLSLLPNP